MKFMKLGTRPDTFFTTESIRSVSSEVSTDIKIRVEHTLYLLHKFPLLSKCLRLRSLCSSFNDSHDPTPTVELPGFPGGAEAFEVCAKYCYGMTVTLSALNFVPVRCAAEYLQMSDDLEKGNLVGKLETFFKSCILRRWKDAFLTLQSTRKHAFMCEELGITARCIEALAAKIVAHPTKEEWSRHNKGWWCEDVSELVIDHYWRLMLAIKASGSVPGRIIGESMQVYANQWLPSVSEIPEISCSDFVQESTKKQRLLLEKLVSLLPSVSEKGSVPCSFLLKLLRAAGFLDASGSLRMELAKRVGLQLEEASVADLLILASGSADVEEGVYDVDIVMTMVEEFFLQGPTPPTSPLREKVGYERRRSRSAENAEFDGMESRRRSSSASHSSRLRVAKLVDGYLQEIAGDPNLNMDKVIALAAAVPDFSRIDQDDLYNVIDIYLRAHPEVDKYDRKKLCRILNCKKLSVEACMHAAQNDLLPLRVIVQVLFFEQARTAASGRGHHMCELPSNIKALLATRPTPCPGYDEDHIRPVLDENWSVKELKSPKLATLKMKLEEAEENGMDDDFLGRHGLLRSSSSRLKAFCAMPNKPKRMLSRLWSLNRSVRERQ